MTLIGILSLGSGYFIVLATESPALVFYLFFVAVLLVMIGIYTLFIADSIALLKILKKNKKFYYKPNHFINISSMIYRIKQNAVGLANICILSTAILFMLFTTASLYLGIEDSLKTRYPTHLIIYMMGMTKEQQNTLKSQVKEIISSHQVSIKQEIQYDVAIIFMRQDKNVFMPSENKELISDDLCLIQAISLSDYNALENRSVSLKENEVLLYTHKGKFEGDQIDISGHEFIIKEHINHLTVKGNSFNITANGYLIVVTDERLSDIAIEGMEHYYGFDMETDPEEKIAITHLITQFIHEKDVSAFCEGREASREELFILYGGFLFIGIFISVLFIMVTVLIIYYKQISEGYEDKNRFKILEKVGMSKEEVKASIKSQVLMVFFLPLIIAIINILVALKGIIKFFGVLSLTNMTLFVYCIAGTILVFTLFYVAIYVLTSKIYYKIVS